MKTIKLKKIPISNLKTQSVNSGIPMTRQSMSTGAKLSTSLSPISA